MAACTSRALPAPRRLNDGSPDLPGDPGGSGNLRRSGGGITRKRGIGEPLVPAPVTRDATRQGLRASSLSALFGDPPWTCRAHCEIGREGGGPSDFPMLWTTLI